MANAKLSDSADAGDCDWSFIENPKICAAIRNSAKRVASLYSVDEDDLYQEAVLFLAVRPAAVAKDMANGAAGANFVGFRASGVMRDRAIAMQNKSKYEDYPDADTWWDGVEG
jgi:hypothetical protein